MTATTTTLNPLNMRRDAVQARQDLSWELRQQGFSNADIMRMVGFNDTSSVSTAVKRGRERAALNAGRTSFRRFGVEIEFTGCTRSQVERKLRELDPEFPVEIQGYNHRVQNVWKLITDASVSSGPEGAGLEAVSPILSGDAGYKSLATMLKAIREAGGRVDRSCGIHVHHDANDMTPVQVAKLVAFYVENQSIMDQMVSQSRRSRNANRWCRPVDMDEHRRMQAAIKSQGNLADGYFDRYRTVNITSYPKYGTVEFRQHQGTLNARKITAWVKVGQAVVEAAMKCQNAEGAQFTTLTDLLDYLTANGGLDREVADYMLERAEDLSAN